MVNVHFKCRHISQSKGLIDVINYWKWKDKETAKLRKEMPIQCLAKIEMERDGFCPAVVRSIPIHSLME